jgi:hypothetical protein
MDSAMNENRGSHKTSANDVGPALGDPNPVQATAKIVPGGWDFRGKFPGSGVEVLNGTRLDFNAAGNIDWNIGSVEFWVMSYSDMRDATNHKFFCTPIGHGTDEAVHIWKTAVADDLRIRVVSGTNMDAVWAGVAEWKAKEWHHIAATWDHEDEGLNLYADGELVASNPAAMWEFKPGYATFSVGGQGGTVTTNGIIDELVIYDYVLSEEEVKEHFNAVQPPGDKAAIETDDKLATTWGSLKGV